MTPTLSVSRMVNPKGQSGSNHAEDLQSCIPLSVYAWRRILAKYVSNLNLILNSHIRKSVETIPRLTLGWANLFYPVIYCIAVPFEFRICKRFSKIQFSNSLSYQCNNAINGTVFSFKNDSMLSCCRYICQDADTLWAGVSSQVSGLILEFYLIL